MRPPPDDINVTLMLLEQEHFYGSLELKFEDGQIVLIRKSETIKPKSDRRGTRGEK